MECCALVARTWSCRARSFAILETLLRQTRKREPTGAEVRCAGTGTWRLRIAATCRRCHGAPDGRNCNLRLEVRIGLITSSQVERPRKPACAPRSSASAKTTIPRRPRQLGEHRSVDLPRRHASDDRTAWEKHRLHEDLLSRRTNQRAAITSTQLTGSSAQPGARRGFGH